MFGLCVIAIGTNAPELAICVSAVPSGSRDIALGNIVGSNIFNALLILGTTSVIKPFAVSGDSIIDTIILLSVTIYLIIASATGKKISRAE